MSERLTDEELEWLAEDAKFVVKIKSRLKPGVAERHLADIGQRLSLLVAEVRASRALLAELEWSGCEYPEGGSACPICLALSDKAEPYGFAQSDGNHKPGCKLAALLGVLPGVTHERNQEG